MDKIEWLVKPKFQLLEAGGWFNRFRCLEDGSAKITIDSETLAIFFKKGWETDVTSSPWWARSLASQLGPHTPASLIHDKLLDEGFSRRFARKVLNLQLRQLELVHPSTRRNIIRGVWLYDVFIKNKKAMKKILPLIAASVFLVSCVSDGSGMRGVVSGLPYEKNADGVWVPKSPDEKTFQKIFEKAGMIKGGQGFKQALLNDLPISGTSK